MRKLGGPWDLNLGLLPLGTCAPLLVTRFLQNLLPGAFLSMAPEELKTPGVRWNWAEYPLYLSWGSEIMD